jgi:hypothetical protein
VTAGEWQQLRLGPFAPRSKKCRWAIISLHIRPGEREDLSGTVEQTSYPSPPEDARGTSAHRKCAGSLREPQGRPRGRAGPARAGGAPDAAGTILTKLDEAARIGGALDCALRHKLKLLALTNGQRVPEDIHHPNARLLAHLSLKPSTQQFTLADEESAALASLPSTVTTSSGAAHA